MPRLGLVVATLTLFAGCAPAPPEAVTVDRVEAPLGATSFSVLAPDRLLVEGAAEWQTSTVRELVERRAVTEAERASAMATLASGAYLGDPVPVLMLTPADEAEGFESGTTYLPDPFPLDAPPGPFEMSATFELAGEPGASAGISIELRAPDALPTGDVGELLVTLMDPGIDTPATLSVYRRGAAPSDAYEPVGSADLEARDWRGPHRLDLNYSPGQLVVSLDGEPLVAADVRLGRPAGPVYLGSFAPAPTMGVVLLDWTFRAE